MEREGMEDGTSDSEFLKAFPGSDSGGAMPVEYWQANTGDLYHASERLIADPLTALLGPETFGEVMQGIRWDLLQDSLDQWASRWWPQSLIDNCPEDVYPWLTRWRESWQTGALPIGQLAMRRYFAVYQGYQSAPPGLARFLRFAHLPSFTGDESAAGILSVNTGGTECDAFCLAELVADPGNRPWGDFWRVNGDVRFHVNGDPDAGDLPRWRDRVREWWRHMAGQVVTNPRHRPKGSTLLDPGDVIQYIRRERLAGRARTQIEVAVALEVSERTLSRWLSPYGGWQSVIRSEEP